MNPHNYYTSNSSRAAAAAQQTTHRTPPVEAPPSQAKSCPHWRFTKEQYKELAARTSSKEFQDWLADGRVRCTGCLLEYPVPDVWLCLHCDGTAEISCRCGRRVKGHALAHYKATNGEHSLCINLQSTQIWCYACDDEIPNVQSDSVEVKPQHIRDLIVPPESDEEEEEDEKEEQRMTVDDYLTNAAGGQVGMSNLGNTCFFNAATQAIIHSPAIVGIFSDLDPLSEYQIKLQEWQGLPNREQLKVVLAEELQRLVRTVWRYNPPRAVAPREMLRTFVILFRDFGGYGQHDSQEYLRFMLDAVHEAISLKTSVRFIEQSDSKQSPPVSSDSKQNESQNTRVRLHQSLLADVFEGELRSEVRCSNCGDVSITVDPFFDISLEIPKDNQLKRVGSERGPEALTPQPTRGLFGTMLSWVGLTSSALNLQTCLHAFCTSEMLVNSEQYRCDNCKQKVDAKKMLSVATLPEVLCFHIKRYVHNSYFGSKINKHVEYPLRDLDMSPFMASNMAELRKGTASAMETDSAPTKGSKPTKNKASAASSSSSSPKSHSTGSSSPWPMQPPAAEVLLACKQESFYDLFAVVEQIGSMSGGHYVCYAKSHVNGCWYRFDDRVVTPVDEASVRKVQAYMLFYQRQRRTKHQQQVKRTVEEMVKASRNQSSPATSTPPSTGSAGFASTATAGDTNDVNGPYYVSQRWIRKVGLLAVPGPVDNRDLCCMHGVPYPHVSPKPLSHDQDPLKSPIVNVVVSRSVLHKKAVPVSSQVWHTLIAKYGGGPEVRDVAHTCVDCERPVVAHNEKLQVYAADRLSNSGGQGPKAWYIISNQWLSQWKHFLDGGKRPGSITNEELLEDDRKTPRPGLVAAKDYRGLHKTVWDLLLDKYGGGPSIIRSELDIYGATPSPLKEAATPPPPPPTSTPLPNGDSSQPDSSKEKRKEQAQAADKDEDMADENMGDKDPQGDREMTPAE